jgi:uncharacterized membrane protein
MPTDPSRREAPHLNRGERGLPELYEVIQRAFSEFLTVPTVVILGFLLLAAGSYAMDRSGLPWLEPVRSALKTHIFADSQATSDLLSTIAAGLMTVTSITISLLLLAVQQTASSMTSEVVDQFLRRTHNQLFFGFFVGLALYALVTLGTVSRSFNPVLGATLTSILTAFALYGLILLLYTTINQMRTVEIVETIHDHTLAARERQLGMVLKTRASPKHVGLASRPVDAARRGFVTKIDVDAIGAAAARVQGDVEVLLSVSIGSYVAFRDVLAEVRAESHGDTRELANAVRDAISLGRQRDLTLDPSYGIEQLETIAWTSISSSKSNPAPGLLIIRSLRDLLARWSIEPPSDIVRNGQPSPVVYHDDVFARLMNALESLAVVSTESMQHQNFAEVVRAIAVMFDRLPVHERQRAEDLIRRILSGLADHVLTGELDDSLTALSATLRSCQRSETAAAVTAAQRQLGQSVGKLNSRSSRSQTDPEPARGDSS